jgi:hypothetical protein
MVRSSVGLVSSAEAQPSIGHKNRAFGLGLLLVMGSCMSLEQTETAMDLAPADCSCAEGALEAHSTSHHEDEVCPLCLARYAAALERVCIVCEAPSCPDCAETLAGTDDVLCFACPSPTRH